MGGNTFYLLHHLRGSGTDKVLVAILQNPNVVYLGISAGSVILGPTIKEASVGNPDPNGIGLTDFTGLGILAYEKTVPHKVIRLTDIQAMIVLGSNTQLVS